MTQDAYIRKETMISMIINGAFSLIFFLIIFRQAATVPLWGAGNWVFDMLPQSFMVTLMSTLVPGAITARRLRAGVLQPSSQQSRLPRSLVLRALLLAVVSAFLGTGLIALIAMLSELADLPWTTALLVKILYGILLSALVTPIGLRAALGSS